MNIGENVLIISGHDLAASVANKTIRNLEWIAEAEIVKLDELYPDQRRGSRTAEIAPADIIVLQFPFWYSAPHIGTLMEDFPSLFSHGSTERQAQRQETVLFSQRNASTRSTV